MRPVHKVTIDAYLAGGFVNAESALVIMKANGRVHSGG